MKKYQSYKPSGIEWIGDIPEHWGVNKLKYLSNLKGSNVDKLIYENENQVFLCNYTDVYKNEFIDDTIEFKKGSCSNEELVKFKLRNGDVIITKDSESPNDIGIPSYVCKDFEDVVCGYHLTIISSNQNDLYGSYLFRQLQTKRVKSYFEVNSNGITRFGLGKSSIENLLLIQPPISEQQQIVQFLNEKTQIIDKLISTKVRKIELLKLQRTSLINQVITQGLNPNVKMKESGLEWISRIPSNWEIKKTSYLCSDMISGPFGSSLKKEFYTKKGYKVYGQEQVIGDDFNIGDYYISDEKFNELKRCEIFKNDILISCVGTFGKISIVPSSFEKGIINPRLLKITPKLSIILPTYFLLILRSDLSFSQLKSLSRGGTMGVINLEIMKQIKFPLPPISEQHQIVENIETRTKEIDDLISLEQRKIDVLKDYRKSLISEVITGKIDVRTNLN